MNFKIYCEGITDQIFIADCLETFYGFNSERKTIRGSNRNEEKLIIKFSTAIEIIDVGGCTKLSNDLYLSILEDNKEGGGVNIVIFDADYESLGNGNKGFKSCVQKLEDIKKTKKVEFEYYVWPNNIDDGIIEDLLRKLIPVDKEAIYQCIESHHQCLSSLPIENVRIAELKEKVGYYLYTVNQDSKTSKRNYKDKSYWHLDSVNNIDLNGFKTFLDSFFLNVKIP